MQTNVVELQTMTLKINLSKFKFKSIIIRMQSYKGKKVVLKARIHGSFV